MKNLTKTKLVFLFVTVFCLLLILFHVFQSFTLVNLEKQLDHKEKYLSNLTQNLDSQIATLDELLRNCQMEANEATSSIVCSKANMHYLEAQKYLDSYYIEREVLEKTVSEYTNLFNTSNKLCTKINSISNNDSKRILQVLAPEEITTHIDEFLDQKQISVTKLVSSAQTYADDLYNEYYPLMVKLVTCEAGEHYYSDNDQFYVMNVAENRVESKHYPNSLYEVIFQKGQYAPTFDGSWKTKIPNERTEKNVEKYLKGKVQTGMPENVVYQAMFKQGSAVWKHVPNGVDEGHFYCIR